MNTAVLGMGELSWYKDSHFHINDRVSCSEHAHGLSFLFRAYSAYKCMCSGTWHHYMNRYVFRNRCRWPCGLRRRSAATRLLASRVRIPWTAWSFVFCVCVLYRQRPQRLADHSFRGVLLVVSNCVWSVNLNNELLRHRKNKNKSV